MYQQILKIAVIYAILLVLTIQFERCVISMQEPVLFGTYTKKSSHGIYRAFLDTETKTLSKPELFLEIQNPTYLTLSPQKTLLTISSQETLGGISSYNDTNQALYNEVLFDGPNPCYVSLDEDRQLVYSANYHKGEILSYQLAADQTLTLADRVVKTGSGPLPEQTAAHMHYSDLTPDKRLVAIDLGADTVYTFDVAPTGKLTEVAALKVPAGFGPRHLVFAPNKQYAYLVGELSSQVATLRYHDDGHFDYLGALKTIPADWTEHNGAAAIRCSQDGKFVYVSNRGHNSLAVFTVQADHSLTLSQLISTAGEFPRDFALDPSEHFVVVANQNTDNASLYERDTTTGQLTLLQADIALPEGVCVCFE